jgi:NADPH-dependent curcumin reductase CurA
VLKAALSILWRKARVVLGGLRDQCKLSERPPGLNWASRVEHARLEGLIVHDHLHYFAQRQAERAAMIDAGILCYHEDLHDGMARALTGFIGLLNGKILGKALAQLEGSPT